MTGAGEEFADGGQRCPVEDVEAVGHHAAGQCEHPHEHVRQRGEQSNLQSVAYITLPLSH